MAAPDSAFRSGHPQQTLCQVFGCARVDDLAANVSDKAGYERRELGPEPKRSFGAKVAMLLNAGEDGSMVHRAYKSKFGHGHVNHWATSFVYFALADKHP